MLGGEGYPNNCSRTTTTKFTHTDQKTLKNNYILYEKKTTYLNWKLTMNSIETSRNDDKCENLLR